MTPSEDGEHLAEQVEERSARKPDPWGRRRTRAMLFVLYAVLLATALSLVPSDYAFQLGYSMGQVIICSTIFLCLILFFGTTRKPILIFCAMALAQAGCVAFVGLRFRSEESTLQRIMAEVPEKQKAWAAQMARYRVDDLFETLSGKRPFSAEELTQFNERARAGEAKVQELKSEAERFEQHMQSRVATEVGSVAARDFQRGVESRRTEENDIWRLLSNYYSEVGQLTGFLIDRRGRYRTTDHGVEFYKEGDAQEYNERIDAVERLREQINSAAQKAQEVLPLRPPRFSKATSDRH
jgi:hypothetical protein